MSLEVEVVATGVVIAEVRAAALSASKSGVKNGVGNTAQGLGFGEAAACLGFLCECGEYDVTCGLGSQSMAQCRLITQQAGASPHVRLQLNDQGFDPGLFIRG